MSTINFFAGDVTLLPELDAPAVENFFGLVNYFKNTSGLTINHIKFEIMAINSTQYVIKSIARKYGCNWVNGLAYIWVCLFSPPF